MQWKSTIHDNIGNKYLYWTVKAHFSEKKEQSSLWAMMYIIFPFTGFTQDSCPAALHCHACSAALWFHPLAVYNTLRLLSKKSLKCSCWCLSAGEEQQRLKLRQEKLGKSEWRALSSGVRVCARPCCRAPGLISRKLYLLFGSSVARRWPWTLNKQGAFDTLPVPFHPNHPWQLQTGVTEMR